MEDLRISDAARLTGLSRSTVLKKVKIGEIKSYQVRVPWGNSFRAEYRIKYEALLPYISLGAGSERTSSKDLITLIMIIHKELQSLKEAVNVQNELLRQIIKKNEKKNGS